MQEENKCRDGEWHTSCPRLFQAIIDSQGTSEEKPVFEFFQFIFIWAIASLIFFGILFVGGWFILSNK